MHILALETDVEKIKRSLMGKREDDVMTVHQHWLPIAFKLVREVLFGVALLLVSWMLGVSNWVVMVLIFLAWVLWTLSALLKAYVLWKYTFLFLTREKVVIVRQHLLHKRMLPITLNNIQSVEVVSQYWDLFGFGKLNIRLRDSNEVITFHFVPDAQRVARKMSNIVSMYNQRIGLWEKMQRNVPPVQAS